MVRLAARRRTTDEPDIVFSPFRVEAAGGNGRP
jgi:hypothetical protein